MDEKESSKDLKVPFNTSDRNDYIQGIGSKEIFIILMSLFVIVVIAFILYFMICSVPVSVFSAIFLIALVIMTVKRDAIDENMIDKVKNLKRYLEMQKHYEYQPNDVIEVQGEENAEE